MGSHVQHSSGEAVSADEPDDTNDMSFPEFQESLVATALHKVRRRWLQIGVRCCQ